MKRYYFTRALALGAALCGAAPAFAAPLADDLIRAAPDASADAVRLALAATECAVAHGQPPAERLAVIDYSRASTEPRLWVFDLTESRLLYREWVAHGRNSGDNYARTFSNAAESHASSLGLFRTLDTYQGHNGYSLRLDGLEPGFNDHALERAIVMHGAAYVNPEGASAVVFSDNESLVKNLSVRLSDWRTSGFVNVDPQVVASVRAIASAIDGKRLAVRFQWIRAHNGNAGNERADALATSAAREARATLAKPQRGR